MTGDNTLLAIGNDPEARVPAREGEDAIHAAGRQLGLDAFRAQGLNLRGREDWKYADLATLTSGEFTPYEPDGGEGDAEVPSDLAGRIKLIFRNGVYLPRDSAGMSLPEGVDCRLTSQAPAPVGFGTLADMNSSPFLALNSAFWSGGMLLEVADGVVLDEPIHLHFLTDSRLDGHLVAMRNFVRLGEGARATIIEHYHGVEGGQGMNLPVTEVFCAEQAQCRHLKIVDEAGGMLHLGGTHVHQAAGSRFTSREFALGGAIIRRELHLDLAGSDAFCDLTALSMGSDQEKRDMRTRVDHSVPGCETLELYKGIFDDKSKGIFDGRILVARDAQQTNAHQTNRNLLLSDDAVSNSIPRLEIYADDVKCSHGSTTGRLGDDEIFFLRSRGFDPLTARVMLARAFAGEVLDGVEEEDVRRQVESEITDRLIATLGGSRG